MVEHDRDTQAQRWSVWGLVLLGLMVAGALAWWEHWRQPTDSSETSPSGTAFTSATTGPEALFATLGIHRPAEPAEAPDFTLAGLNGQPTRLRELRGKVVLLNFWATWCAPCLQEMPSMERLHQTFQNTAFALLAVSMDRQGAEVARPFVDSLKLTFPVLLDPASDVARQYGVRGLPTTYLIDADGRLIGAVIGARDWHRTEAKALIAGLVRQTSTAEERSRQVAK